MEKKWEDEQTFLNSSQSQSFLEFVVRAWLDAWLFGNFPDIIPFFLWRRLFLTLCIFYFLTLCLFCPFLFCCYLFQQQLRGDCSCRFSQLPAACPFFFFSFLNFFLSFCLFATTFEGRLQMEDWSILSSCLCCLSKVDKPPPTSFFVFYSFFVFFYFCYCFVFLMGDSRMSIGWLSTAVVAASLQSINLHHTYKTRKTRKTRKRGKKEERKRVKREKKENRKTEK